jgi:hypothetical protein
MRYGSQFLMDIVNTHLFFFKKITGFSVPFPGRVRLDSAFTGGYTRNAFSPVDITKP